MAGRKNKITTGFSLSDLMREKVEEPIRVKNALKRYKERIDSLPLVVSFSGGRSSAMMTKLLLDKYKGNREVVVVFANTSREHEATLRFVDNCDKYFGFNTVWIEAKVHHDEEKSCTHTITNFKNALRGGELFMAIAKKYGIPNVAYLHCTRELKTRPIQHYSKTKFGLNGYATAIGMRGEESGRMGMNEEKMKHGVHYPLAEEGVKTSMQVLNWWTKQPFDLTMEDGTLLPERLGNCITCHKKSDEKLFMNYQENPAVFDLSKFMEQEYGTVKQTRDGQIRNRWRGQRSTAELIEDAKDWIEGGIETEFFSTSSKCSCGIEQYEIAS